MKEASKKEPILTSEEGPLWRASPVTREARKTPEQSPERAVSEGKESTHTQRASKIAIYPWSGTHAKDQLIRIVSAFMLAWRIPLTPYSGLKLSARNHSLVIDFS
jgi:hypothetical protein